MRSRQRKTPAWSDDQTGVEIGMARAKRRLSPFRDYPLARAGKKMCRPDPLELMLSDLADRIGCYSGLSPGFSAIPPALLSPRLPPLLEPISLEGFSPTFSVCVLELAHFTLDHRIFLPSGSARMSRSVGLPPIVGSLRPAFVEPTLRPPRQ